MPGDLKEALKTNKPASAMYRSPEDAAKAPEKVRAVIADFADRPSRAARSKAIQPARGSAFQVSATSC
jgi:hypothetical protein